MMRNSEEVSFSLARAALAASDPELVPVLDELGLAAVRSSVRPDGALGGEPMHTVLKVASEMGLEAGKSLVGLAAAGLLGSVSPRVRSTFRRLFHRKSAPAKTMIALPVTPEQAHRAADVAMKRARSLGMSEAKAKVLADAMVGALLTGELARPT